MSAVVAQNTTSGDYLNITAKSQLPFRMEPMFIEELFDFEKTPNFMRDNWTLSFYAVAIYLAAIFFGQKLMANRPPMNLNRALIAWNFLLAVFSIMGTIRVLPFTLKELATIGYHRITCNGRVAENDDVLVLWGVFFGVSKIPELLDTAFLVLRKRRVIFLHWYHHVTVLLYCFYAQARELGTNRWFMLMNFYVHALMYTYYLLRALKIHVHRHISMAITFTQIAQMFGGIFITGSAVYFKLSSTYCDLTWESIFLASLMYLSYLLLFVRFFVRSYLKSPKQKKID